MTSIWILITFFLSFLSSFSRHTPMKIDAVLWSYWSISPIAILYLKKNRYRSMPPYWFICRRYSSLCTTDLRLHHLSQSSRIKMRLVHQIIFFDTPQLEMIRTFRWLIDEETRPKSFDYWYRLKLFKRDSKMILSKWNLLFKSQSFQWIYSLCTHT